MPGEAVQIGPFVGGLNTFSDETAVADNELVTCENFELDLDGSLKSRPPIVDNNVSFPLADTGNILMLGYYYAAGGLSYLLASDGKSSTYYFSGTGWVLITNTVAASAVVQFDGKVWMVAPIGSTNPGGSWTPTGGFVAEPDMPKGETIVAHKFRLWIAAGKDSLTNATRLYFSTVLGTADFWPTAPDFIDIGAGDGQAIVQVVVYYNSLLIFRTSSIYGFAYTSDPASGNTSLIVPGVGLASKDTIVAFESYLYFMFDDKAYEFINNRATQINVKVPFEAISRAGLYKPFAVSMFGSRVIFSYYDTMFVFGLRTRTWTTWRSTLHGPIGTIIQLASSSELDQAVLHSSRAVASGVGRVAKTLFVTDGLTSDAETMQCLMQTKNYNYEASSTYKRLFWWGADAVFRGRVTAIATPVTYNYSVSWGTVRTKTWGQIRMFSWAQPISEASGVETIRDTSGSGSMRKFVKFMKGLRFRQISYRLIFDTDGSINSAPVRLFSIMTFIKAKERVSKTVT